MISLSKIVKTSEPLEGLTLFSIPTSLKDAVVIDGSISGGRMQCRGENPLIADATAAMLDEGTKRRNKRVLREKLDRIGASVEFSSDNYRTHFSAQCPAREARRVIEIIAEMLREPALPVAEFAVLKRRLTGESMQARENTALLASRRMLARLYPKQHPNYDEAPEEEMKLISRLEKIDLSRFHASAYGLGEMRVSVAGDSSKGDIGAHLKDAFCGWRTSILKTVPTIVNALKITSPQDEFIPVADKANVDIAIGIPIGMSEQHEDYYPLFVGVHAFGGTFFSRLMQEVRVRQGLTYGVYAQLAGVGDGADGYFSVRATFAPEFLEKGKKAVLDELTRFVSRGMSAVDLLRHQRAIAGNYAVGLGSAHGLAHAVLGNAEQGRPLEFLDQFPTRIKALTLAEVNAAIKRRIDLNKAVMVGAGTKA